VAVLSYTKQQLIDDVRRMLQEKTASRYTDTDVGRWADEAVMEIVTMTRCLRTSATATSVSGQDEYTIPADAIGAHTITRMDYDNALLRPVAWDQIGEHADSKQALTTVGSPRLWSRWARSLYVWPVPNSSKVMKIWYAKMPRSLTGTGDSLTGLGVPECYGPAIEEAMLRRGLLMAGRQDEVQKAWEREQALLGPAADKEMPDATPNTSRGSG